MYPDPQTKLEKFAGILDKLMLIVAGSVIATLIIEYGFYISDSVKRVIQQFNLIAIFYFVFFNLSKLVINPQPLSYLRKKWIEFILTFLIILQSIGFLLYFREPYTIDIKTLTRIYIASAQIYLTLDIGLKAIRYSQRLIQKSVHPARLLVISFMLLIFGGTLLLLLPKATYKGISIIDALFTATSAVCVTGLTVVDTGKYFTTFGQLIIMFLIQLGGLGIMTFTTFFMLLLSGGLGIKERLMLGEIFSERNLSKISSTVTRILFITFAIEAIGAIALYNFLPDSIFKNETEKIFCSIFHSISAFCNAGFSTFSNNLMDIKNNIPAILTIATLIILGGLGFIVLSESIEKPFLKMLRKIKFLRNKIPPQRVVFSLHSKLAISTTAILIIFGSLFFFILEFNNSLKAEPTLGKVAHAFFQAVTPRTAGFNTIDISKISITTTLFIMLLMWIGASPGSTGGGIKTTSFALIVLKIRSMIKGDERVEIFNKQISEESVSRAFASGLLSILLILTATFILTITEKTANLIDIYFETVSAFGTVGLSRGITPNLTIFGKLIIITMMFIGRVGPLVFSFALFGKAEKKRYELQKENVLVT
ncbi:potassium uptake protein, TrkH family [Candidatus Kryptonium thompsonii]|uniref:Potassium uptake protein, TrkH family n=2 Tax=Candidatus Kryptonium thompsonii TaxID=1633631 RepID=A0A0P1LT34_9BACT|nr:TrkH family potassium uptake protein [Candidatus Kryptonium thompsoni]CUS77790.1 potassium uptake protein, TrkH family [Candidatus Kryptonium thompsoni]CUS82162.1 potassium uptake protein, TrkH family [Candidatus Kryptonium thompsoni]CUS83887.1 potassium uptake protein, TrkH family [Candidatus Kryptonium thompsoni]CUS90858.1 potassium uptake protein, TrkH family [Candidatus Kryptonium thompsoni]CUS92536.1 potassium uptake protein, TrkH family [Candidatus Kryptonium thompsoni]